MKAYEYIIWYVATSAKSDCNMYDYFGYDGNLHGNDPGLISYMDRERTFSLYIPL